MRSSLHRPPFGGRGAELALAQPGIIGLMILGRLLPRPESADQRGNHPTNGTGGLRAAVLGAVDGIVSTASLMLGVAASRASHAGVITAGIAGVVAGALAMAAGEYVSVSSQRDASERL